MDNNTLKIYTLGRFCVEKKGEAITLNGKWAKKRWSLFQILFTYNDHGVTLKKMMKFLDLNLNSNPAEALKSLVYYLRKELHEKDEDGDNGKEEYILNQGGLYCFNNHSDYWLDAEHFENVYKKARYYIDKDQEKSIEYYKKAIEIYKGDYLLESGNAEWILPVRSHYRNIFLYSIINASMLLQKLGRDSEIIELCEKGLTISPYEEQLHELILRALINMGQLGEARLRFEEMTAFFADNDLEISAVLRDVGERLIIGRKKPFSSEPVKTFKDILNNHCKNSPLICDRDTFMDLYAFEKARNDRNNTNFYLISFTFKNPIDTIDEINAAANFGEILKKVLRKGDIICRWGEESYFTLLTNIVPDFNPNIVEERIKIEIEKFGLNDLLKIEAEILLTNESD